MASVFDGQIQNRNFLSPIGFQFILEKYKKVSFFSNALRIPDISLGTTIQQTRFKAIEVPGDQVQYGDFSLRFLVDESLENYILIHRWITALGFSDTHDDFKNLVVDDAGVEDPLKQFSDGTLNILNSNYNSVCRIVFNDLFPVSLSSLEFEASDTDINYFTAEVVFKYTIYDIVEL